MGRKQTHCARGHNYAKTGRYKSGHCAECRRIDNSKKRPRSGRPQGRAEADEIIRTNAILALVDEKWKAATPWDRRAIQARIDALSRKGA